MKIQNNVDTNFICDVNAPCFQSLSFDEIELVRTSKTQLLFRKGDNLTKHGAFASYVLFMLDGIAKQYVEGETSKKFNLRIIQPGEFIGLSTVFSKNTFNYSAVAIMDCQVLLIEKEAIVKVIKSNGEFSFNLIRRYCEQNSNLYNRLGMVLHKQMNGKLAETLIYLNELKEKYKDIFQLLSRKDIADFAALSTESTVKLLKSFEKDGMISLKERDIEILRLSSLKELSKIG